MDVDEGYARLPAVSNQHTPGDMPDSHHHSRVSGPTAGGRSFAPRRVWAEPDAVDLSAELRFPVATIRDAPFWFRGSIRRAYRIALSEWRRSKSWKLFVLIPRMLFRLTARGGKRWS